MDYQKYMSGVSRLNLSWLRPKGFKRMRWHQSLTRLLSRSVEVCAREHEMDGLCCVCIPNFRDVHRRGAVNPVRKGKPVSYEVAETGYSSQAVFVGCGP